MVLNIPTHCSGFRVVMVPIEAADMVLFVILLRQLVVIQAIEVVKVVLASLLFGELAALGVLGLVDKQALLGSLWLLVTVPAAVDGVVHDAATRQLVAQGVQVVGLVVSGLLVEVHGVVLLLWLAAKAGQLGEVVWVRGVDSRKQFV